MNERNKGTTILLGVLKYTFIFLCAMGIAAAISLRTMELAGVRYTAVSWDDLTYRISGLEQQMDILNADTRLEEIQESTRSSLYGKKIVYDGDSIAESRGNNGGGYAAQIAWITGSTYENFAKGGARLTLNDNTHSVVNNLENLPEDGDLYCFEGGINDFWSNTPIGYCDPADYTGELDLYTICGAMEHIFRYCQDNLPGKPVCFVITHKIQSTAFSPNGIGNTFTEYRNAMVEVCEKYSIPYYDAFNESGLNGRNTTLSELFLNANAEGIADGCHPNEEGYKRYYVPQLLDLFEKIMPVD